jgi:hypothetical protein
MVVRFFCGAATFALIAVTGCGRAVQTDSGRGAPTAQPSALEEVTVTLGPGQQSVAARVGQVIVVLSPDAARRWQVDYASDVLEALTPPDQMQQPGKAWRFRSSRAGETDVRFTAIGQAGSTGPPAPPQFVFTVRVTP